ncbi:uncharacterized protein PSANT_06947 [Moesziomyces antarcticus]|uniref:Uncharacterized protein n=1 Tax=Pseudozyma antarctica TaxID=84753 RepID=A0A5C3FYJ4_PSEA2|nr:uncharacterized protein PSANT_06947 [Moesziomyces antarcticus]
MGDEVKAANYWDVWRLKTKGKEFTVNFEFVRPRMGGDEFLDIRKNSPNTQGNNRKGEGEASNSKVLGKRKSR